MLAATISHAERNAAKNKLVAVAIDRDKDKGSQSALKWAADYILSKGQTVLLIHVKLKPSGSSQSPDASDETRYVRGKQDRDCMKLFMPSCIFCRHKDIDCQVIVLEHTDIVKGLIEYVTESAIEILVLGAGSKGGGERIQHKVSVPLLKHMLISDFSIISHRRFFKANVIPESVSNSVPDFCTVYVISNAKIYSKRAASRSALVSSPLRQVQQPSKKFRTGGDNTKFLQFDYLHMYYDLSGLDSTCNSAETSLNLSCLNLKLDTEDFDKYSEFQRRLPASLRLHACYLLLWLNKRLLV